MNDIIAILAFVAAVVAPMVLLVVFTATGLALGYLIFLVLTYQIERVRLSEAHQNKKLLKQIRAGRV
jgi:hypothetical protein